MSKLTLITLSLLALITPTIQAIKNPPTINNTESSFIQLVENGAWRPDTPLRLHLGCGEQHFDGYINIDYPPANHTVQTHIASDVFADITTLKFPTETVDEVRNHHLFEHFDRSMALALLCKWQQWLKIGGTLYIETPDFKSSIQMLVAPEYSYEQKQIILRHVFGSHEASWAIHCDGWYDEKYQRVLTALGFGDLKIELTRYQGIIHNIKIKATKKKSLSQAQTAAVAKSILKQSLVNASEGKMFEVWCQNFDKAFIN
jgi:predicted SAM-dependent methyltransferase